jgi:hypothetical protein
LRLSGQRQPQCCGLPGRNRKALLAHQDAELLDGLAQPAVLAH